MRDGTFLRTYLLRPVIARIGHSLIGDVSRYWYNIITRLHFFYDGRYTTKGGYPRLEAVCQFVHVQAGDDEKIRHEDDQRIPCRHRNHYHQVSLIVIIVSSYHRYGFPYGGLVGTNHSTVVLLAVPDLTPDRRLDASWIE